MRVFVMKRKSTNSFLYSTFYMIQMYHVNSHKVMANKSKSREEGTGRINVQLNILYDEIKVFLAIYLIISLSHHEKITL